MTPYLADPDVTLYHGDALETLRSLPDGCVDMVATSPPFYGLRDYGMDGQIGLEETPDQWVQNLVAVFRECRRVLADHGTLWVEIGDSYASAPVGAFNGGGFKDSSARSGGRDMSGVGTSGSFNKAKAAGVKQKDLIGSPWMLAFALRADGWYLRSEIIWARPNPMPESVTDRPTKAHSTVFLLSKQPRYFYDADAIREDFQSRPQQRLTANIDMPLGAARVAAGVQQGNPQGGTHINRFRVQDETLDGSDGETPRGPDGRRVTAVKGAENSEQHRDGERWPNPSGANARTVWTIPTEPTPFAHFATWPRKLVARMVQAGTSERGKCPVCGKPWVRDVERTPMVIDRSERTHSMGHTRSSGTVVEHPTSRTLGWSPSCACDAASVPGVVLDPFSGSGTTLLVARHHGRHSIGIELNQEYCKLAADRLSQLSLLAETNA